MVEGSAWWDTGYPVTMSLAVAVPTAPSIPRRSLTSNMDLFFRIGDGVYEVSVESRAGDNVWTLVRRGLSGIDVLGQAEADMKTRHNIKPTKQ